MKSIIQICRRALILQAFVDRCAIEDPNAGGKFRTVEEREKQRKKINNWLIRNKYHFYLTDEENKILNIKVGSPFASKILNKEYICEALEPLLWSVKLINELTPYYKFVLTDFHPILEMGKKHSINKLLSNCNLRPKTDIIQERNKAMIWHWRAIEGKNITKNDNVKDILTKIFGGNIEEINNNMKYKSGDLNVNSKPFRDLEQSDIKKIELITQVRHHAYEWILSEETWDKVSLIT